MARAESNLEERLKHILDERARRLGIPPDQAQQTEDAEPFFLSAADHRAEQLGTGITAAEILAEDLRRLRARPYPGAVCLQPFEVEEFTDSGVLAPDRLKHQQECSYCAALLAAARPRREKQMEFLESLRETTAQSATQSALLPRLRSSTLLQAAALIVGILTAGLYLLQEPLRRPLVAVVASAVGVSRADRESQACARLVAYGLRADGQARAGWEASTELGPYLPTDAGGVPEAATLTRVGKALGATTVVQCSASFPKPSEGRGARLALHLQGGKFRNGSSFRFAGLPPEDFAQLTVRATQKLRAELDLEPLSSNETDGLRLLAEATTTREQGRPAEALAQLKKAENVFATSGSEAGVADALREQGVLQNWMGSLEDAAATLKHALEHYRAAHDVAGEARVTIDLGHVADELGERDDAMRHYQDALELYQRVGNKEGKARALIGQAIELRNLARWAEAEHCLTTARDIYHTSGNRIGESFAQSNLGTLQSDQGRLAEAQKTFEAVLATRRDTGQRSGEAWALEAIAETLAVQGEFPRAEQTYGEALQIRRQLGEAVQKAGAEIGLAWVWAQQGRLREARQQLNKSVQVLQTSKNSDLEVQGRTRLADVLLQLDDIEAAHAALSGVSNLKISSTAVQLEADLVKARIAARSGDTNSARSDLEKVRDSAHERQLRLIELEAQLALGEAELETGNVAKGQAQLASVKTAAKAIGANAIASTAVKRAMGRSAVLPEAPLLSKGGQ